MQKNLKAAIHKLFIHAFCFIAILSFLLPASIYTAQTQTNPLHFKANLLHFQPHIKLVVVVIIDQFRQDYLTRFQYHFLPEKDKHGNIGGFKFLLENGAVFTNTKYNHIPTHTGVGHASISTGAPPYKSGIIANNWFNRLTNQEEYCIRDPFQQNIPQKPYITPNPNKTLSEAQGKNGANLNGVSPKNLRGSTIADELKIATQGKAKVVSISIKDRSAVIMGGHRPDLVLWFSSKEGKWISSTYYFPDKKLPDWVIKLNNFKQQNNNLKNYNELLHSIYGNELLADLAIHILNHEELGKKDTVDYLAISFSSNDLVGHRYGPSSQEVKDLILATDKTISTLLNAFNKHLPNGLDNLLFVLTSDHGVMETPETLTSFGVSGGRLNKSQMIEAVSKRLSTAFGPGNWVLYFQAPYLYLNQNLLQEKNISLKEAEVLAMEEAQKIPGVAWVFTRSQILDGKLPKNKIAEAVSRSFDPERSGDIVILPHQGWNWFYKEKATHGTPYTHDSHVPLIFMGNPIRKGWYHTNSSPEDIAPTIATLLGIEQPSGSEGRILHEALR